LDDDVIESDTVKKKLDLNLKYNRGLT